MALYAVITVFILLPAMPFELFFGCRGGDTRSGFTDHLYSAFTQAGIRTFREDDGVPLGENIRLAIKRAMHESKVSVVVLSKDYATSRRCLDELVMIMERRTTDGHIVVPIFYHVDPSDVGEQTGTYAEAFEEHKIQLKEKMDRVEGWKTALKEVAELQGIILRHRYESQCIQHIVQEIENKLNRTTDGVPPYFSWNNVLLTKLMATMLFFILPIFLPGIKRAIGASKVWVTAVVNYSAAFIWQRIQHIVQDIENKLNRTTDSVPPYFSWNNVLLTKLMATMLFFILLIFMPGIKRAIGASKVWVTAVVNYSAAFIWRRYLLIMSKPRRLLSATES